MNDFLRPHFRTEGVALWRRLGASRFVASAARASDQAEAPTVVGSADCAAREMSAATAAGWET
jgi:hypothetical protein